MPPANVIRLIVPPRSPRRRGRPRPDLKVNRGCGTRNEGRSRGHIGLAVRSLERNPNAVSRVVGEEQRAHVTGRIGTGRIERESRDRRASGGQLSRDDARAVRVREVRRRDRSRTLAVQRLAHVEVRAVEPRLPRTLITGPPEVLDEGVCGLATRLISSKLPVPTSPTQT